MRCPGFGLVLLGVAMLAHGAEPENGDSFHDPDQPTVQIVQLIPDGRFRTIPYRLVLHVVPTQSTDAMPLAPEFGTPSRFAAVIEKRKEITWNARARCMEVLGRCRTSLLPLLRLESNGGMLEVKPRRHALSIEWRRAFD